MSKKRYIKFDELYPIYYLTEYGNKTEECFEFSQEEISIIEEASQKFDKAQRIMRDKYEEWLFPQK